MKTYRARIIQIYLLFIFIVLPLIYHNSYIDIRDIKVLYFWRVFIITGILMVLTALVDLFEKMKTEGKEAIKSLFTFDLTDVFLIGFGVVVLISCMRSRYGQHAFTGDLTFKVGGYLLLALIFMYLFLSHSEFSLRLSYVWAIPVIIMELLAILNSLDLDPLHMTLSSMTLSDKMYFVSTIGHIDYLSEYFCLFIPFYIVQLLFAKKSYEKIVYSMIVFLGYLSCLVIRANGLMLGCLFGLFVIGVYCLSHKDYMKGYLLQYILLIIACILMDLINHLFIIPAKQMPIETLPSLFVNKGYFVIAAIVIIGLVILNKMEEDLLIKVFKIIQKALIILFIIGLVAWFSFAIYCTLHSIQFAIFNNRINIWRGCIESFKHMSLREKLVGVGPNCVSDMLNRYTVYQGVSRTTAHNELLEYFLSTGLLGGACYFMFWIMMIKSLLTHLSHPKCLAYLSGLVAYIGISLVVGPSFLNTVTLFTFLTLSKISYQSSLTEV